MVSARKRIVAVVSAVAAVLGVCLTASPAQAGYDEVYGCPPGNVCLYRGHFSDSEPVYMTQGTPYYSGTVWGVVNNGTPLAGADHFYLKYRFYGQSKWNWTCFHYTPGSGSAYDFPTVPVYVSSDSYWGGEC